MPPEPPGYRIDGVLGRGGMGTVHRAYQRALGRAVALKTIAPEHAGDPALRARFMRESRLAASLEHPHVVPVYEAGEHDGALFIVMRLVEGTDLGSRLRERGPLPPAEAVEIIRQVAAALDAAHAAGLVHRDVKPSNILLAAGEPPHAYLSDFGLAISATTGEMLTSSGAWIGTLDYAAPEQITGREIDARTDVYALGCVLFAALAGRPPFAAAPAAGKAAAHAHEPPPTLAEVGVEVPGPLQAVLDRALAKDPADRFPSAGALAAAAAQPQQTGLTRRLPREPATVPQRRPRRRPPWLAAAALLVLAGAGAAVLAATSGGGHQRRPTTPPLRRRTPPAPAPLPVATASAGSVRCTGASCRQGAVLVAPPIQGSPCARGALAGQWLRIDHGLPEPLLLCVPTRSPPSPVTGVVPDLAGARLDLAEHALDRLGLSHDTSGGGLFGVVVSSNWTVCTTTPAAGATISSGQKVRLFVDRSC